jgi:hypothetical protein
MRVRGEKRCKMATGGFGQVGFYIVTGEQLGVKGQVCELEAMKFPVCPLHQERGYKFGPQLETPQTSQSGMSLMLESSQDISLLRRVVQNQAMKLVVWKARGSITTSAKPVPRSYVR